MPPVLSAEPDSGGGTVVSGGGLKDLDSSFVTGGNAGVAVGGFVALEKTARITLDADAGDVIGVDVHTTSFGGQVFFRVATIIANAAVNTIGSAGWYRTTDLVNQGIGAGSGERKYTLLPGDVSAGTVTLELQASAAGGGGIVLEGSLFEATNYGPVAA